MLLLSDNRKNIQINWLTLSFADPFEKDFQSNYVRASMFQVRLALALGIFLYGIFGLLLDHTRGQVQTLVHSLRVRHSLCHHHPRRHLCSLFREIHAAPDCLAGCRRRHWNRGDDGDCPTWSRSHILCRTDSHLNLRLFIHPPSLHLGIGDGMGHHHKL